MDVTDLPDAWRSNLRLLMYNLLGGWNRRGVAGARGSRARTFVLPDLGGQAMCFKLETITSLNCNVLACFHFYTLFKMLANPLGFVQEKNEQEIINYV